MNGNKNKIFGAGLIVLAVFIVIALTLWLATDSASDTVQANKQVGIQLSIETTNTMSNTILTHGKANKNGEVEWGEIYIPEAGFVAVKSVKLPMAPEAPTISVKEGE